MNTRISPCPHTREDKKDAFFIKKLRLTFDWMNKLQADKAYARLLFIYANQFLYTGAELEYYLGQAIESLSHAPAEYVIEQLGL